MNKRFSTLLAAVMVAGGFSFNVAAAPVDASTVKDGSFIHLTTGSNKYLAMDEKGDFSEVDGSAWAGKINELLGTLWQVKLIPHQTIGGTTYTYSFTNRLSGQLFSVKLQSDVDGGGRKTAIASNEKGGNTEWAWDDANGLYAVKNYGAGKDTTFTIGFNGTNLVFDATKGTTSQTVTDDLQKAEVSATAVTLTADDFNALVEKEGGKLFFTDENVSSTEKNVLTANKWKAVAGHLANDGSAYAASSGKDVLYLTNGKEYKNRLNVAMDEATETQREYLLVDYNFYDPDKAFNVLKTDTIAAEPKVAAVDFADRTKIAKHHPATAAFIVTYFIPNDSMVIAPAFVQTSIPVMTTLNAQHALIPSSAPTEATAVKTAVDIVKAATATFSAANSSSAFPKGAVFASDENKYDAAGASGSATTGNALLKAVKDAKDAISAANKKKDDVKKYLAAVDAYISKLNGLTITTASTSDAALVSTTSIKDGANYADGLNSLTVEAVSPAKQVVIRKLSNTKVLTIGQIEGDNGATSLHGNLIATIKTSDKAATIGGDAEIAEGVYFIKDMRTLDAADATKANAGYGFFYNQTPVGPIYVAAKEDVAKEQAFNPYAQFVIEKAAGTEKGNYVITNLGTGNAFDASGVTNKVSDGVYAIGTDTFSIVAAATDLEDLDEHMGYKYISNADYLNNKFTITSAADVLFGQTIVMRSDSSLKVAEGEMLFTLKPQNAVPFGYNEALEYVPVTIMNADSAYIAYDAAKGYFFTNGKTETASGIAPKEFRLIAVDTDSTYVLYDGTNKMVVSTQYKTISAGAAATERNDLFIVKKEAAPASYKSLPKHVRIQAANTDYVAVNSANQGVAVREGDLKAAYDNLDFIFWLDTAQYENAETYKYYITKGVKAEGEVAASRLYMWSAQDSTNSKNTETFKYGNDNVRVLFRTASIMTKDTLFVPTMDATAKIDTVSYKANKESADGLKHEVKGGLDKFQFSFEFVSKDAENEYNIVSLNGDAKQYVHSLNGVLVMGGEKDALVVNVLDVTPEDEAATGNETINAEGVKVIAANGGVQIIGAQDKKVVITNILGQTVANTVITSDNATIAAPAGVVVVAIEGEEAVKAIVK